MKFCLRIWNEWLHGLHSIIFWERWSSNKFYFKELEGPKIVSIKEIMPSQDNQESLFLNHIAQAFYSPLKSSYSILKLVYPL